MAQVTVGRFGTSFDIDAHTFDLSGDKANVQGYIDNTDRTLLALARQQLNGLTDPDERVVPVTFASDSSLDGYYQVDSASVEMDAGRYAAKSLPWAVSLTRLSNFRRPNIELRTLGKVRTNVDSFTDGTTNPTAAVPYGASLLVASPADFPSYTTAFGDVGLLRDDDLRNRRTIYKCAPTDYYVGACRVEQKIGSTWYPIVGRQHHAAATDVRVNNGLLRIAGYTDATPASSGITMEAFDTGSTWGPAKTWNFRRSGASFVTDGPQSVDILRNRPEECVIRLAYPAVTSGSVRTILYADVRLMRGWRMGDVTLSCSESITWAVKNTEALTSATGGYEATSADASSMKVLFASRSATSLADTNTSVVYGTSNRIVFGLGVRKTVAGVWGSTSDAFSRWFAYLGSTQTVGG